MPTQCNLAGKEQGTDAESKFLRSILQRFAKGEISEKHALSLLKKDYRFRYEIGTDWKENELPCGLLNGIDDDDEDGVTEISDVADTTSPEEVIVAKETYEEMLVIVRSVAHEIKSLSRRQRECLHLYCVKDQSKMKTAQELGISRQAVDIYLSRSRKILRKKYEHLFAKESYLDYISRRKFSSFLAQPVRRRRHRPNLFPYELCDGKRGLRAYLSQSFGDEETAIPWRY